MTIRKAARVRIGLFLTIAVLLFLSRVQVKAQIIFIQNVDGKRVMCTRSGMSSDLSDCSVQSDSYTYVFIGSISAVNKASNSEQIIQIVPEEVFSGVPDNPTTALTSQGLCLPKLTVGDRWLFYLRKDKGKQIVLDYYGNDSIPAKDAQEQINTLRRLKTIGNFGILRGKVWRGTSTSGMPISHATVIAHRQSDQKRFIAESRDDGRYEFQPLPPGDYKLKITATEGLQPDDSEVEIRPATCWTLNLTRSPHARLAGHVRDSNGSPLRNIDVVLIDSNNEGYMTTQTNRDGRFLFDSLAPGRFIVGLNFPRRPDWFNGSGSGSGLKLPPASLFYPGVDSRSKARVIRIATDEKIDTLDFLLPAK